MRILFVCTGNTCRSPMAEALFSGICPDEMVVFSRGIEVQAPSKASENAIFIMEEMAGLDISFHLSKQLTIADVDSADIIFCMTGFHKQFIDTAFPMAKEKTHILYEFAEGKNKDVSDPYGGDVSAYRHCAGELNRLTVKALYKLNCI